MLQQEGADARVEIPELLLLRWLDDAEGSLHRYMKLKMASAAHEAQPKCQTLADDAR